MADDTLVEDPKFYTLGRDLANTEKRVRDKAVETIRRDIIRIQQCTELEMMKLWKGLFYTFWMSDKPLVQEELAIVLSEMLFEFRSEELSWMYIVCFWKTMIREWGGIDMLRMDKFLLLIRKFTNQTFSFLEQKQWKQSLVEQYQSLVNTTVYNEKSIGLFSQYCECFLDELHKQNPHISSYDFMNLIRPFFHILEIDASRLVVYGIKERVFLCILDSYETYRESLYFASILTTRGRKRRKTRFREH
ncbi:uncharacterized protein [Blastocystis hominis]|uniref:Uncharacterized protein n=1 Tax=Blastocystis hominis TaxID=12968 RepID=D8M8T0_BLAHO|nr:uncharacterized protein [Blastocystis hominis]CBK24469.2 unnamed protein product [Blastocystis hominis]|eukprot:XP_012898517.1 uncharacterized protein [Blastocystis hominis]